MKILLLGPIKSPIIQRLRFYLEEQGVDVVAASFSAADEKHVIDLGSINSFFDYFKSYKLNRLIDEHEPDLIHAHVLNHYGLMASLQKKIPIVVALWGSDVMLAPYAGSWFKKKFFGFINWWVLKQAARCHTSGLHVTNEAKKQLKEYSSNKFDTYYWGFPLRRPNDADLKVIGKKLYKEFGIPDSGLVIFPRGLGHIYSPKVVAEIINLWGERGSNKTIVIFKGFATVEDVNYFFKRIISKKFIYIDRLLSEYELYFLYSRCDIHFSIPTSDSLGGGVVEPALLGSFPVLSDLPSYREYLASNVGCCLEDYSKSSLRSLIDKIEAGVYSKSPDNKPSQDYSADSVVLKILRTYEDALVLAEGKG